MSAERLQILLIEDNPDHAALIRRQLTGVRSAAVRLDSVSRLSDGVERLRQGGVDAVLTDLELPDSDAQATLSAILSHAPGVPVIALTARDDVDEAALAVQKGAQDYLVKTQITGDLLVRAIRYAIERKRAEEQLKSLNETLEQRVAERTAVAEQRAEQLRMLAADLARTEQRERRRLAQVLHDHLQQLLVAAKMGLGALRGRVQDDAETLDRVDRIESLLTESIDASRSLTVELSPPVLQHGGLAAALTWLADWMNNKHGLSVELQLAAAPEPAAEDVRTLLFEVVRELLFNVVKHANTAEARVELAGQDDQLRIEVSDPGRGFDPAAVKLQAGDNGGFGYFSIHQRLQVLGGRLELDSAPGQGTRITIFAPLHDASHPQSRPQPLDAPSTLQGLAHPSKAASVAPPP